MTAWVLVLTPLTAWRLSRASVDGVNCLAAAPGGLLAWRLLRAFGGARGPASVVEYSMGDLSGPDGRALRYEIFRLTQEFSVKVADALARTATFAGMTRACGEGPARVRLERLLYRDLYPVMALAAVARASGEGRAVLYLESMPHCALWEAAWPAALPAFRLVPERAQRLAREVLKGLRDRLWLAAARSFGRAARPDGTGPCLAIHYVEGLDGGRSDLYWRGDDAVPPERVVFYFDESNDASWSEAVAASIERLGMRWVLLRWRPGLPFRELCLAPAPGPAALANGESGELARAGGWLAGEGNRLAVETRRWEVFYRRFGVRLHLDAEDGSWQNPAQSAALDRVGGLRVNKQRSETFDTVTNEVAFYSNHVYFTWNRRGPAFLSLNRCRVGRCVVAGFPYALAREGAAPAAHLRGAGARTVAAVFDNVYSREFHYSRRMVEAFYGALLDWAESDASVALLVKSKKPVVLESLPEVRSRLSALEAAGRCAVLADPQNRLPSEAGLGADISIGLGISSAVTEVVALGGRGVHLDLTRQRQHPFYQWGHGRVIFDDARLLLEALRAFHAGMRPDLGDFSAHQVDLDPFGDARGGRRIGRYLADLLEHFAAGAGPTDAADAADRAFAARWGADKLMGPAQAAPL